MVTRTAGAGTVRRIASRSGSKWDIRMSAPAIPRNLRSPSGLSSVTGTVIVTTYRSAQEKSMCGP
jgi:hypothetical protein